MSTEVVTICTPSDTALDYEACHTVVVAGLAYLRAREWQVGAALSQIRQHDLWMQAALASFEDYCAQPEVDVSLTRARRYIRAWERFGPLVAQGVVTEDALQDLGVTKADLIGPAIDRDPARAEEWVETGRRLTKGDLKKELRRNDPAHPRYDQAAALTYLEEISAKGCSLFGRLPDRTDPPAALAEIVGFASEAISIWRHHYAPDQ